MLKGLCITPPIVGRISIGRVVERNGKRLPQKDDQFTITSQVQLGDEWVLHPLDETLRKEAKGKLRTIPVRMPFNDPALNLRASYTLFDRSTGRPICVGNGETCTRHTDTGVETLPCPSPGQCAFGGEGCKPYARVHVVIGDEDVLGTFVLRTTSFNTIRTLTARLQYFNAVSGSLLACMPLELRLRGKSTTMSYHTPIYYVDLVVRSGLTIEEAIDEARTLNERRWKAGFDQQALDEAARRGFANGTFEEAGEDVPAVVEEFFPEGAGARGDAQSNGKSSTSLSEQLEAKVSA
ncbi:MAG TPA: hydrolase or metal-binding protein, partial [Oleiagrimonas sp.]|nr:hydrolase or metal-binding protein [Oleiagrimonas sp.]